MIHYLEGFQAFCLPTTQWGQKLRFLALFGSCDFMNTDFGVKPAGILGVIWKISWCPFLLRTQ